VSPSSPSHEHDPDPAPQRAQFEAEISAAGLTLSADDRERLFAMWADHLPMRDSLRAAVPAFEAEPSFIEKPTQPGGGVTIPSPTSGGAA
jgi:hypothetical protein